VEFGKFAPRRDSLFRIWALFNATVSLTKKATSLADRFLKNEKYTFYFSFQARQRFNKSVTAYGRIISESKRNGLMKKWFDEE